MERTKIKNKENKECDVRVGRTLEVVVPPYLWPVVGTTLIQEPLSYDLCNEWINQIEMCYRRVEQARKWLEELINIHKEYRDFTICYE